MWFGWVWIKKQKWWGGLDWVGVILGNWFGGVLGWFLAHY
jgi:hypothetical protein